MINYKKNTRYPYLLNLMIGKHLNTPYKISTTSVYILTHTNIYKAIIIPSLK